MGDPLQLEGSGREECSLEMVGRLKHGSGGRVRPESPVLLSLVQIYAGRLTVPEFLLHVLSNCSRLSCHLPLSDAGQKKRLSGEEQDEVETVMVMVEEAQEVASQRGRWRRGKQGLSEATFDCRLGHVLVRDYY